MTLPDRAALTFRRRAAAAVLALTVIVYPVAWDADAYIFGIAVLGFVPVQLTLAAAGGGRGRLPPHRFLELNPPVSPYAGAGPAKLVRSDRRHRDREEEIDRRC